MKISSTLKNASHIASILVLLAISGGSAYAESNDSIADLIEFDQDAVAMDKTVHIAYLSECAQNPYCQARLRGIEDAAEKYNFEFQLFDANFNPANQLKQVQNASSGRFDAFIFAPTAGASGCNMWRQFLQPTGKPVVTINMPMCGDDNYTEGLAATVTMQSQPYFDTHIQNAFASCEGTCKAAAIGGYLGSDLWNKWNAAVNKADEMYPNVEVVVNEPGKFDPRTALRVMQDGLTSNPDISIVVSSWDDMTRGIAQAITSNGQKPGTDVRIYSLGANQDALSRVKAGSYNSSTILLPYEESYYGAVAAVMALQGQPLNAYINEALLPAVTEGPGSIIITPENANRYTPLY